MIFSEKIILGRTGLKVGRLGISSSFGAPVGAYEAAIERGCNYVTWGTFIKGRSDSLLQGEKQPGIVSFTATAWGRLLNLHKVPPGEKPLTAADCYRFALSHPAVDVCMIGAASTEQMLENLEVLEQGPLTQPELERVRRIGDYVG